MIRKSNSRIPLTFFHWQLSEQVMRPLDSFGLKVCAVNAYSIPELVENHLIKCNQPPAYLYFIITDRWTQKRIQNPVKLLRWSILQRYLAAFSCYLFTQNDPSQGSEYASGTLKVDKNFKQLLKFISFDSKFVLIGNK